NADETREQVKLVGLQEPEDEEDEGRELDQTPFDRVLGLQEVLQIGNAFDETAERVVVADDSRVDQHGQQTGVREEVPDPAEVDERAEEHRAEHVREEVCPGAVDLPCLASRLRV